MQGHKDNEQISDSNSVMDLAISTVIGDREEQQDSFGYEIKQDEALVVVCDGMGGHEGGKTASSIAVNEYISLYKKQYPCVNCIRFLEVCTESANRKIANIVDDNGRTINAGSTVVAILIHKKKLYWSSVGDSRAYLLRNSEFVQFTLDHNYNTVLKERLEAGLIDEKEFEAESSKAEALISYLGIGNLKLIDYNDEALNLCKDDKIIIMTDGLYKIVSEEDIFKLLKNSGNIKDALSDLEVKAQKNSKQFNSRDNMTVAIIAVK